MKITEYIELSFTIGSGVALGFLIICFIVYILMKIGKTQICAW
jgi:hypothetical protein